MKESSIEVPLSVYVYADWNDPELNHIKIDIGADVTVVGDEIIGAKLYQQAYVSDSIAAHIKTSSKEELQAIIGLSCIELSSRGDDQDQLLSHIENELVGN